MTLDRLIASILLVSGLPLIGLLALLVRATSRGPGLIRQKRVGQGGKVFTLYKIRTMFADAEARTGAVWSRPGDPRVTAVGRILRRLHLDEFPQLFNVLKGEMSLVGPRPECPEFINGGGWLVGCAGERLCAGCRRDSFAGLRLGVVDPAGRPSPVDC